MIQYNIRLLMACQNAGHDDDDDADDDDDDADDAC